MSALVRFVAQSILVLCVVVLVADFNQPAALAMSGVECNGQSCTMSTICNALYNCANSPPFYCICPSTGCTCKQFG